METRNSSVADIQAQLDRILVSSQFRDSPRLQAFLRFVVSLTLEGKADQIKESTIAAEVFGRQDTSDDPIVRSSARRLRARLEDYYQDTGAGDPLRIVIPKGGYVPDIEERPTLRQAEQEHSFANPSQSGEAREPAKFIRGGTSGIGSFSSNIRRIAAVVAVCATCFGAAMLWSRGPQRVRHPNAQAEELYLKGRYYWSKRTPGDLNRAVDYFTQAIVKDPGDAQAYAGLADTYNLLSEYTVMPYEEAFQRARAAAETAIRLDGSVAEAHNSLAFASFYGAWDPVTAEREFKRALELDPKYVMAHHWYATFLMSVGRKGEALAEIGRAQALDPSSKSILADKGLILMIAGQLSASQALLEEVRASDPQFLSPHRYLASVYLVEKRYADYLSELKSAALLLNDPGALALAEAGQRGLAAGGARGMLEQMLSAQETSSAAEDVRYYRVAQISALLGERTKAIHYLQLALERRDTNLLAMTVDPCFTPMHADAAFQAIVKRVGVA